MAYITIGGQRIRVDDSFAQMTPAQQQATVDEIAAQMSRTQTDVPPGPSMARGVAGAMGQGLFSGFGEELAALSGASTNVANQAVKNLIGWSPLRSTEKGFGESYADIRDAERRQMTAFAEQNPGIALASEVAGGLLTGGFGMAKTGGVRAGKGLIEGIKSLAKPTATGAVQGGLYGAGTSEADTLLGRAEDAATTALLGGGMGAGIPALGKLGGALLKPVAETQAAQVLKKAGVSALTRAQKLGEAGARGLEGTLQKIPFIGSALVKSAHKSRQEFQSAMMGKAGFSKQHADAGLFTDDVILETAEQFNNRYRTILQGREIDLGNSEFLGALSKAGAKHSKFIPRTQKQDIKDILDELAAEAKTGPIAATSAHEWRSHLSELAWDSRDTPKISAVYRSMREALDNEFDKMTAGGVRAVNKEYSRFSQLRDTYARSGSIDTAEGLLPLPMLERVSKKSNLKDKDWRELINSAQKVLPDKLPDSGTASRLATLKLLGNMLMPSAGAGFLAGPLGAASPYLLVGAGKVGANYMARGGLSQTPRVLQSMGRNQYGLLANPLALPLLGQ